MVTRLERKVDDLTSNLETAYELIQSLEQKIDDMDVSYGDGFSIDRLDGDS